MAVAGLVLGIIAIIGSFIPCINFLALIPGVLGIIFSGIGIAQAKKKGEGKGMAIAGLILSILSVIWVPIAITLLGGALAGISAGM